MHLRKAMDRNESLKIAISIGHHPAFLSAASMEFPYGYCEYDFVGALQGEPVQVIEGPYSGLPVPSDSEIVLEGEIVPGEEKKEGPFGEWTGYYASPPKPDPLIRVHSVLHRKDPIILGAPPVRPPAEHSVYRAFTRAARIWDALEASGVPGVKGVWCHPAGGSRMLNIVSIEQKFLGHARQAGLIAAQCQAALYANRYTIVVDDDIDPTDTFQVLWALCTRSNPETSIQLITRSMRTRDDPIGPFDDLGGFASRAVIEACKPYETIKDFPLVSGPSDELRKEIYRKFRHVFEG
jgi:4-hydroxy-3-polyprenylbenzoate decarboxylase